METSIKQHTRIGFNPTRYMVKCKMRAACSAFFSELERPGPKIKILKPPFKLWGFATGSRENLTSNSLPSFVSFRETYCYMCQG